MLLSVKNDIREIDRVFSCIKEFCHTSGVSEKKCFDILIIIDELATNVISYAFNDGQEHTFTIAIDKKDDVVHIRISDAGIPFDPLKKNEPDTDASLESRKIGGLGIFFVKQLSQLVTYERVEDKNQLDIFVSLKEEE